ncbi:MAG: hypothetical protein A3I44_02235 [Candidatus Sungbacteria bacterium RIFCSPLOWO2_02_FULL_51_17]|uniref:nicotinamidase n=1 Tax=Candidatus Sungbacteria bacterium RIFCSPHIGHO2_02_FULL_51_29 TaxID=1802273 RepID=A0A1G2L088_9BACT|nr:MAG: hypothetical protein A3C16_02110 [Candidatus Sungbacteria bacterium RIFCSPHIGHO2_02_FULL_51_29]OHA04751.1 MAG: hypothetical protein A3B29_01430 [Candidatus Sungbacteria bacterium RIFCSPLOWO2_01_FULL_51_34]OHA12013.1 MAG: hypothetical protein A3I44_02235 [Candidatus Sungbacteria bacterium RIFCSPLOWO2_02_FULL_51_17]
MADTVLLIVDAENDFFPPNGALPVPDGTSIIPPINRIIVYATDHGWYVVTTRDLHETEHDGWPLHCKRNTWGAEFHPDILLPEVFVVVSKGTRPGEGAYSGFHSPDGNPEHSKLHTVLQRLGVKKLVIAGLATDYCVRATVLDALRLGYEVVVLEDAIRGVEVNPGDSARAIQEMKDAGATFMMADAFMQNSA